MERTTYAMIGFGEAGRAFAAGHPPHLRLVAYDRKTQDPAGRAAMLAVYAAHAVEAAAAPEQALKGATAIFSLVTADQALAAAEMCAETIRRGALWLDMNSVAPQTKRAAAAVIAQAGARYVDVAIMAPVEPARRTVPLLLSGPHSADATRILADAGFANVGVAGDAVGHASAIKMIRSVMVKGIEALSAECALAAYAGGVAEDVIVSLDASWPGADWRHRFDYNLDRMLTHGVRRAAEMEEVVKTLDALGTGSEMTRGTVERQRALGKLGARAPEGLAAKIRLILDSKADT